MSPLQTPSRSVLDHAGLEALLGRAIRACEGGSGTPNDLWAEFEGALARHFEHEERVLLAPLLVTRPREANVIMEEHRHLRRRVAQLDGDPRGVVADALRTFLDELRAHGRHEDRTLYPWAERSGLMEAPGESW
jgi:hemerythrin-like domain-containing protein